jgi:hypothetical protein
MAAAATIIAAAVVVVMAVIVAADVPVEEAAMLHLEEVTKRPGWCSQSYFDTKTY